MSLIISHNAGFFSCCSVKLSDIINYININSEIPKIIDSSLLFNLYKVNSSEDITYEYFEHYDNINDVSIVYPINAVIYDNNYIQCEDQFINYSSFNYDAITPLIKKYFTPSKNILKIIDNMEEKYNLYYENICVLFYRGNDKYTETILCNYEEYLNYANYIMENNPNIIFLIQSDETEFIEFMSNHFPNNSFYFKDEIRHIRKCKNTVDIVFKDKNHIYSKYYLAITIIMSKCKYIICGSGNCSKWIMYYRGNNKNVYQYLNCTWFTP